MTSMCWKGRNRLKIGTCLAINSTAGGLLTEGIGFEEKRIVGQIVLLCAFAFEIRGYSGRMRHCGGIFYNRRTEGARGKWKAHCKCRYRQCYYKNPFNGGMTRRLRRGSGTYRPKGHSHFSFDGERKVCKRKPAARHYGKKALIAHLAAGLAMSCAMELVSLYIRAERTRARLFPLQKWAGLFPFVA